MSYSRFSDGEVASKPLRKRTMSMLGWAGLELGRRSVPPAVAVGSAHCSFRSELFSRQDDWCLLRLANTFEETADRGVACCGNRHGALQKGSLKNEFAVFHLVACHIRSERGFQFHGFRQLIHIK